MAPARSTRRNPHEQSVPLRSAQTDASPVADGAQTSDLFLEPMMGTPLTIYIEKEVEDRDTLVELITVGHIPPSYPRFLNPCFPKKHGGTTSPGYSGTPYILGQCRVF